MPITTHLEDKIQYVLDAQGNKTAVLIPINLWDQWGGVKKTDSEKHPHPIKKYRGILKGKGYSGKEEENNMRDEWD